MIRVVLADDHTVLRDGIRALLAQEPDLEIVGQASNGLLLLELLAETTADVVVLDVNMPAMNGLAATKAIREQFPTVRVLVLSMLDHEYYVNRMLEAGALGYVLKTARLAEIIHAIRTVSNNAPFLGTAIGLSLLPKFTYGPQGKKVSQPVTYAADELPEREQQVLHLLSTGLSNAEIANQLLVSKRVVGIYYQSLTPVRTTPLLWPDYRR